MHFGLAIQLLLRSVVLSEDVVVLVDKQVSGSSGIYKAHQDAPPHILEQTRFSEEFQIGLD